jgi:hypothetical protein
LYKGAHHRAAAFAPFLDAVDAPAAAAAAADAMLAGELQATKGLS